MTEDIKEAIVEGIEKGFELRENSKKSFRVPADIHKIHHDFLSSFIEFLIDSRKIVWRVILTAGIIAILGIFALGIGAFIYAKSKGYM